MLCLLLTASSIAQEDIQPAQDVYRLMPITYDGATGNAVFQFNDQPFGWKDIGRDETTILAITNKGESEISLPINGGKVRNGQKISVYIGFNVTRVQVNTEFGFSAEWVISSAPLKLTQRATAIPSEQKTFWVLKKYIPSEEGTWSATSCVIDADTYYKTCLNHLSELGYDDAEQITLPVEYKTTITNI